MLSLLTLPFKIALLLVTTVLAVLRSLLGLVGLLLNPFIFILVLIVFAAIYFL